VSGHGFAPALLVASTQILLVKLAETHTDVGEILTEANAFLERGTEDDRFVTVFLGRIDPESRSFEYVSAGHPTGYVLDERGFVKAEMESTALPLAVLPNGDFPKAPPLTLAPGDTVVLLTDGILEARSAAEQPFGSLRAIDVVRTYRDRTAREIIDQLYRAVCEFTAPQRPWDDVTAMVIKVGPNGR
jgi:sigma-B regulation protein RsbU (phosphoserine phosphatase)